MRGTKKLLIGFIICMALAGGISISQEVRAAENDFIIQDEVLSQDSISDSAIQGEVADIENDSLIKDEILSQNDVDDSVIQDRAASSSDFVIENGVLKKYTGSGGDVVIPDGVREIGVQVFLNCSSIESVTIPSSVTEIHHYAFGECTNLTEITIPGSVTVIDDAFYGCVSLTEITIPDNVTYISPYAFGKCTSLQEINVDVKNSVYLSEDGVLYNKDKTELIAYPGGKSGDFKIPSTVTEIGFDVFDHCVNLSKLMIPHSVSKIDAYSFYKCTSLQEINVDTKNPSYSSEDGIMYNKDKTVLMIFPGGKTKLSTIPTSVTSIGEGAFSTSNLVNITIPNTVTNIGVNAFAVCLGLTHITIPTNVTTIGMQAFAGCENLEELTILNPQTKLFYEGNNGYIVYDILDDGMGPTEFKNSVVIIKGYKNSTAQELANHMNNPYRNTTFKFVALDGIGGNTPKPNKPKTPNKGTILKSKNTTYTVTKKGSEVAFTKISSAAASVSIPNTVKIGGINYKVTSISSNAFKGNKKLSKVTIGANITFIGKNAFNGCKNLKTITIKSIKLKSIGQNAFKGIKSTALVKVPSKRLKAYKKLLKGKGQGKKVKITR